MNLNPRETRLALITLLAVLGGLSFWLVEPRYEAWRRDQDEAALLLRRQVTAQRLLDQSEELESRLAALREELPQHPQGTDVTAQILRNLQQFADQHNFTLLRREPEPERQIGDLYELAITCTWEGDLTALVRFLYALQAQGAIVDVRQLTVSPVQGAPGQLRGALTVDYAYSRTTE